MFRVIRLGVLIVAAVGLAFVLGVVSRRSAGVEEVEAQLLAVPIRTQQVERRTLIQSLEIGGFVESERMVTVLPLVQGALTSIDAELGDAVTAGETVARVDQEPYALSVRQAEAQFLAAEATFRRTAELFESGSTSRQNYDQALAQYEAAQASLELAELNLRYADVAAPISGVVLMKHTTAGSLVGQQSAIITIGDLDALVVQANIPEQYFFAFADAPDVIPVDVALATQPSREIRGEIRTVAPFVNPATRNFEVLIDIDAQGLSIRPGMFVNLSFRLDERQDVPGVPWEAIGSDGSVWVVEDGEPREMFIDIGFSDGAFVQVDESLLGRQVVVEGQSFLGEGTTIRLVGDSE